MEALQVSGKAGDPIWAMTHEIDGETLIGLRFDCGDAGTLYLTPNQAEEVIDNLNSQLRALASLKSSEGAKWRESMSERERTHEANELLRKLNREAFVNAIDIEQLPHAVGLVLDYRQAAIQSERERCAKIAEQGWGEQSKLIADAIRRGGEHE